MKKILKETPSLPKHTVYICDFAGSNIGNFEILWGIEQIKRYSSIVYLIHEALHTLISEKYTGIDDDNNNPDGSLQHSFVEMFSDILLGEYLKVEDKTSVHQFDKKIIEKIKPLFGFYLGRKLPPSNLLFLNKLVWKDFYLWCHDNFDSIMKDNDYKNLTESEILDERLEVLLSRPKDFFKKEIKLYRADRSNKKFDGVVRRTYLNGGTNLSSPRASSFWTDAKLVAIFYAIRSTIKEIYPSKPDEILDNPAYFADKDGHLVLYARDESYKKQLLENIPKVNKKMKDCDYNILVHEITVKGSDPDLGIGHNPTIREFTLDRDVVPEKTTIINSWPKEYIDAIEFVIGADEYIKRYKNHDTKTIGYMERLIKHHYDGTWRTDTMNPKNLMKTSFFKNEFIEYVNSGGTDFYMISDLHIGKGLTEYKDILDKAKSVGEDINDMLNKNNPRYVLLLGDTVDKSCINNFEEIIKTMMSAIDKYNAQKTKFLYILGNSEHNEKPLNIMLKAFQKKKNLAWAGYIIKTDKYVFTHAPIDSGDKICIHGHLHLSNKYFNADPIKCVNISTIKGIGQWVSMKDVINNINKNTNAEILDKDPTGGKKNKVMTKLYKEYDKALKENKISIEEFASMFLTESAIHSHLNNTVLDKAREIMEKMNDIEYGSVYSNGKVTKRDNDDWYDDSNKFCPQPVSSILKTKVGHCIDQSELERYYFRKAGIKHKVFSMFPERGTNMYHNHTFLVFFDEDDNPYWFDHAWYSERGIHKGESLEALFKKICDKKRKADPKNDPERAEKFKNIKYEIFEVPAKSCLCWDDYMEWVWKQKLVYKG